MLYKVLARRRTKGRRIVKQNMYHNQNKFDKHSPDLIDRWSKQWDIEVLCYTEEQGWHEFNLPDQYYLQESTTTVGNSILFWAKNDAGYTTDLDRAAVYTEAQAMSRHRNRETDIPWLKSYIDSRISRIVNCQSINLNEALELTSIELIKSKPKPRITRRCSCGRFITDYDYYTDQPCKHLE